MILLFHGVLSVFLSIAWSPQTCRSANILALFPHNSESHYSVMRAFVKELIGKEHNVTLYTGHGMYDFLRIPENLIAHTIEFDFWQNVRETASKNGITWNATDFKGEEEQLENILARSGYNLLENFFSSNPVQKLLSMPTEEYSFDIIVVDIFYTESLLALSHHFKCPIIGIISSDFANYMERTIDIMISSACLPYNPQQMNPDFWQRLQNVNDCLARRQRLLNGHHKLQQNLIHKFLMTHNKDWKKEPTIKELQAELTLLLLNNYPPLQLPRLLSMNMIPVGGIQSGKFKTLPWRYTRFLHEARNGAVHINLGDHHRCSTIHTNTVQILLEVLLNLKLKVIWTCHQENEEQLNGFENISEDVMVQHLLPQTDILAHPIIKVFITNGDLINIQDGISRQCPILGIPLFPNEVENVKLVEHYQIGLRLDYSNLTRDSLRWALDTILNNTNYYESNVAVVAKIFRDRPLGGLAHAIFWLEYILNYGGVHLTIPANTVTLEQLHLQDLQIYRIFSSIIIGALLITFGYILWLGFKRLKTHKINAKLS